MKKIKTAKLPWNQPKPAKKDPFTQKWRWKSYSLKYRKQNPVCEVSQANGKAVPVISNIKYDRPGVVDHIIPRSIGGSEWDPANHMSMSNYYHQKKRSLEQRGFCVPYVLNENNEKIPANRQDIINKLLNKDKTNKHL